jgi:hypothetical protein
VLVPALSANSPISISGLRPHPVTATLNVLAGVKATCAQSHVLAESGNMHNRYRAGMDGAEDGERVAASLAEWLTGLTFADQTTDEVTGRIIESVVAWAGGQGWRVYRRASSVMPLPPPYSRQHSVLDVACARPAGPPIAIEVDRADRRRTVDKLLAEAEAGRIPIWVRWGTGRFDAPPPPIQMVTCEVTSRQGWAGKGRLHSRLPANDRPAPAHSFDGTGAAATVMLPIPVADSELP